MMFFFFQAEDGIRDGHVTGVQTCALPILSLTGRPRPTSQAHHPRRHGPAAHPGCGPRSHRRPRPDEIGRASCREREEILRRAVTIKKKATEYMSRNLNGRLYRTRLPLQKY